jgi:hypothetical protein
MTATISHAGQYKVGHPGGPGRKPGARNKLGNLFLDAMVEAFEEVDKNGVQEGIRAIRRCREDDPSVYLRVLAALMPKEVSGEGGGPVRLLVERRIVDPKVIIDVPANGNDFPRLADRAAGD